MKFKTNAKCAGCSTAILNAMNTRFPNEQWSLDLQNEDKVLEWHGVPDDADKAAQVVKTLEETGFKGSWIQQGTEQQTR